MRRGTSVPERIDHKSPVTMKLLLSITALAAACAAALAQPGLEAVRGYSDNFSAFVTTTAGWTFQTSKPVTVTALGCFADVFVNNPIVSLIQVGLWDDSGSLVASNSISSDSPLYGQTRYKPVAEVTLASGRIYHLGAYNPEGTLGLDVAGVVAGGVVTTSAEIILRGAALAAAGFSSPAELTGTTGSLYAGPNFLFQAQPRIRIQLWTSGQVRLSWPTAFTGYALQSKSSLSGGWGGAGLTITVVGSENVAFDTIGPGPKYYRLIK